MANAYLTIFIFLLCIMVKASWGIKRFCLSCSRKFFDLNRKNIQCPYCGSAFSEEEALKNMLPKRGPKKAIRPVVQKSTEKVDQQLGDVVSSDATVIEEDSGAARPETESPDSSEDPTLSETSAEQEQTVDVEKTEGEANKDNKNIDLEDFETDEGEVTEVIDVGTQKKGNEEQ